MDPAKDELRGAYKQFLLSPVGKDLLSKMLAYEMSLNMESIRHDEPHLQAKSINKASGIYWVRSLLDDLSKPKVTKSTPAMRKRSAHSSA